VAQVKDLTELTIEDLWREVKDEDDWLWDLRRETSRLAKRIWQAQWRKTWCGARLRTGIDALN
jgi:hypothetical protein